MDFSAIPLFGAMKSKLGYLSQRQGVLAQNIANADTPGYQAMDVAQPDFGKSLASAQKLHLTTTSGKHFSGAETGTSSAGEIIKRKSTYERTPNGNNVAIEEEMAKVAENQMEYQKMLNIYRKSVDLFKTAIGKPNG